MKLSVLLVCALTAAAVADRAAPVYTVDLDAPDKDHWAFVSAYTADMVAAKALLASIVPAKVLPLVEMVAAQADKILEAPYADEMRGVAAATQNQMNLGDVVLMNLIYDLTASCTSIVADNNGTIYHARNLDYSLTDVLKNMTIEVHFQRGGKTEYYGTTYAGYVGLLTGMRPGAFSVSVDERDKGSPWENALEMLLNRQAKPLSFMIRDHLADPTATFAKAVTAYQHTPLIAPVYIIVGGVAAGEGAIITRDRLFALDVWRIALPDNWWRLETNYDHWVAPPSKDDRRDPANASMKKLGRDNVSPATLFDVLSIPPVLAPGTTYTTTMSASHGYFNTTVRA